MCRVVAMLVAVAATLPLNTQPAAESSSPRTPVTWFDAYERGLDQAQQNDQLLVVYLPPTELGEDRVVAASQRIRDLGDLLCGVLVGAGEVAEVLAALEIKELPAVLVFDTNELELARWEKQLPPDVWLRIRRLARDRRARNQRDAEAIESAFALATAGDLRGAYRLLEPFLVDARALSRDNELRAAEAEQSIIQVGEERVLATLAYEGLETDDKVVRRLRRLFRPPVHPNLKALVSAQARLLESTTILRRITRS